MRNTFNGQVTIPAEIRERAGLLPETEVEFECDGKAVRIRRAKAAAAAPEWSLTCADVAASR